ncbi:MAG: DUF4258 domain-containing protein [Candidatus Methylomirabilis oxyfera]|nr:DUF4258 domain-containing protein [Candidatus Methylomirabilis oxyfera]
MHDAILRRMHELVRRSRYVMTARGRQEMQADDLGIFDVEHCILTGRIIERQRDRRRREWKYLVRGETLAGGFAVTVAKIGANDMLVIITVYVDRANEVQDEV